MRIMAAAIAFMDAPIVRTFSAIRCDPRRDKRNDEKGQQTPVVNHPSDRAAPQNEAQYHKKKQSRLPVFPNDEHELRSCVKVCMRWHRKLDYIGCDDTLRGGTHAH